MKREEVIKSYNILSKLSGLETFLKALESVKTATIKIENIPEEIMRSVPCYSSKMELQLYDDDVKEVANIVKKEIDALSEQLEAM